MNTIPILEPAADEVDAYVAAVRASLSDLPADDVDELHRWYGR